MQPCACGRCGVKCCQCGCQCGASCTAYGLSTCCPCGCQCGICKVNEYNHCCPCNCECGREIKNGRYVCKECSNDCFPSTAMIKLEGGKSVTMSELMIGDKIQAGNAILKLMQGYCIKMSKPKILCKSCSLYKFKSLCFSKSKVILNIQNDNIILVSLSSNIRRIY